MAKMTQEIAKELIPNGYEIDIDGKEYWISDSATNILRMENIHISAH